MKGYIATFVFSLYCHIKSINNEITNGDRNESNDASPKPEIILDVYLHGILHHREDRKVC